MSAREKLLAMIIGAVVLGIGAILGIRAVLVQPLKEIDKKTAALREKLDKVHAERRAYFVDEENIKKYTLATFSDQVDQASAKSGQILSQQIILAGLRETEFSRTPVGQRKLRGALEIGWSVQGEGPLQNIVNLLFLAQKSPYLHKIDDLSISPGDGPGRVKVRFRFLTLVMQPAPLVEIKELEPKFTLQSPERKVFDLIAARDIMRPYIKRTAPPPPSADPGTQAPKPPGPESLKVVSLSEWMGQPEVHVRDTAQNLTHRFKPGDALGEGSVVMIDYRPFPMPGNEMLKSFSRVILKIGNEYWAIERGRTLADKYKLSPAQLPEQLVAK